MAAQGGGTRRHVGQAVAAGGGNRRIKAGAVILHREHHAAFAPPRVDGDGAPGGMPQAVADRLAQHVDRIGHAPGRDEGRDLRIEVAHEAHVVGPGLGGEHGVQGLHERRAVHHRGLELT